MHINFKLFFVAIAALFLMPAITLGGQMKTSVHDDQLDADLTQAPLKMVLADISRQAKIQVSIEQGLSGRITTRFADLSLEEGLKRILADFSNTMLFTKNSMGEIVLSEIKVFGKGKNSGEITFEPLNKVATVVSGAPGAQDQTNLSAGQPGASSTQGSASGAQAFPGRPTGELATAMTQRDTMMLARLRRELHGLRQKLKEATDEQEASKTRAVIAQKTMEIQKRQTWMQARNYGLSRIERQLSDAK